MGDTKKGFIGLDYNPSAKKSDGVAISKDDVKFLSITLLEAGHDPKKRLFLLKPPFVQEQEEGKVMRLIGIETLNDWAKR